MRTNKRNLIIYIVGLAVSILLLGLYFINPQSPWCTIFVSVGASGIGAVILACFIEWSNEKTRYENRQDIRKTKFHLVVVLATRLLERLAFCYFKRKENIFSVRDRETCYRIAYDEFWDELYKQEEYLEQLLLADTAPLIAPIRLPDKEIRRLCESFSNFIDARIPEFITFEAAGYFSDEEISALEGAGTHSYFVRHNEDILDVEELKEIFSTLTQIREFEFLKTTVFYYKGRRIEYFSSQKQTVKDLKFSEEDIKNSISVLEREEYPTISSND